MINKLLTWLLQVIGKKLDGYKTYVGIAIKCLAGLLGILQSMYPDLAVAVPRNVVSSIDTIGDGVVGIGAAHKAQKLLTAVSAQGQAVQPPSRPAPLPDTKTPYELEPSVSRTERSD